MTEDEAAIINQALTDIGAGPMFSIDDETDLAETVAHVWQRLVGQVFGMHDWSFARKTFRNVALAQAPDNGYRHGFDLPGPRFGNPLKIWSDPRRRAPLRDFTIEEGRLYCDSAQTWSLCKVYVQPEHWPPEWRSAFIVALGGYLAVPVWQDRSLREQVLVEAFGTSSREGSGGLFGRLMAQDKASNPVGEPLVEDEPMMAARHGGHYPWHGNW